MSGALTTIRCATLGLALCAFAAEAYCPSYTASSSNNTKGCAIEAARGTNPTVAEWQDIFALVSQGPAAWGTAGPTVQNIGQGCGRPTPRTLVAPRFPCEVLKAIAAQESNWTQFCVPDRPSDQLGGASRTIIAFDCGYGIGQVTSGMHAGEAPNFDRARVAADPTYNLATGTRILAEKWLYVNCVGDQQPHIIEHWYSAIWAYNGLAYSNNPNNPNYSSTRGVWNPKVRGSGPYQEKVLGHLQYPPTAEHWRSVGAAYPKLSDIGTTGKPSSLPDPSCASPTSCTSTRTLHVSECLGLDGGMDVSDGGSSDGDGGSVSGAGSDDASVLLPGSGGGAGATAVRLPSLGNESIGLASGCGCSTSGGALSILAGAVPWFLRRTRRRSTQTA
jgi:hypothetical protein